VLKLWATLGRRRGRQRPTVALQARAKVGDQVSHGTYNRSCCAFQILCASNWLRSLCVRKAPPTMPESAKNASVHEAFRSKGKEASVDQSPTVSTADVTSPAIGVGATAAPLAEKAVTSTALPPEVEQTTSAWPTQGRH
jgi:hypothetical protein